MKTRIYTIALMTLFAAAACNKEARVDIPAPGEMVTIRAILPEDDAVKGAGMKSQLSWTWSATDKLTVVGETTEVFTIKSGFTPKQAEFEGRAVKGTSFTILYPGEDARETSWAEQVQKGNDNLDHLVYQAALENVDSYATFAFSPAWAEEHGGSLKQTGVMKFELTLPAEVTTVTEVSLSAETPIFYGGNGEELTDKIGVQLEDVTLAAGEPLTAWMTTSWNEAAVPAGTTLFVLVNTGTKVISRDIILSKDTAVKTGMFNTLTLDDEGWADESVNAHYAGGKGTKASPWIIRTLEQLAYVHDDLVAGTIRYYKLDADLDLTGVDWTPLNNEEPYNKFIDLDGGNHTISHLGKPLIDVFVGGVKDLVIENADVDGGSAITGILANTVKSGMDNSIVNVDVKNSKVAASQYTGTLIGQTDAPITVKDVDVVNTNVSGTLAGGIVGFFNNQVTMDNCTFTGGTVTSSGRYAGGIAGSIAKFESVISNCTVKDAAVSSTADRIGGLVGQLQQTALIKDSKAENVTVKGSINVGGLIGVCYGSVSGCTASGSVSTTNTGNSTAVNLGGLIGYQQYDNEVVSQCSSSISIDAIGANIGGLVGNMQSGQIKQCFATGNVKGTYRYVGGLVGIVDRNEKHFISDSYCTGNAEGNSYVGGLVGGYNNGTVSIANCFCTGSVTASGFAAGGLIGHTKLVGITVEKCIAWGATVTAGSIGESNWSSGCVVGVAFPICTLTDNYRNPAMALTAYWVPAADYQHANVSAYAPLIKQDGNATTATDISSGQDGYPQFPYHGKVDATKTLPALAASLGWSTDIWDLSGDMPKLK